MNNFQEGPLIKVDNLRKHFPIVRGTILSRQVGAIKAVDGISFQIYQGRTLGLVGESGCGKSTTGRLILQLLKPTTGQVLFNNVDLTKISGEELRLLRQKMQMIFQDSYSSLNPRHSVGMIISEPITVHSRVGKSERREKVASLLELVGLNPNFTDRFPHEFSGGQRQRIGIARALALNPDFLVCDEPISSLDVSIQAQIVNLLKRLQDQLGLTYLFISHDLSVIRHISNQVAVMYLGKIVEFADRNELYTHPLHPYTASLISTSPIPNPRIERKRQRIILKGEVPNPSNPPPGCSFNPRCPHAKEICSNKEPEWKEYQPDHYAACHFSDQLCLEGVNISRV
jgi:oligopeptide transport system ATP-binding protein